MPAPGKPAFKGRPGIRQAFKLKYSSQQAVSL